MIYNCFSYLHIINCNFTQNSLKSDINTDRKIIHELLLKRKSGRASQHSARRTAHVRVGRGLRRTSGLRQPATAHGINQELALLLYHFYYRSFPPLSIQDNRFIYY